MSEARETSDSETAHVHIAARRRGGCVAACLARRRLERSFRVEWIVTVLGALVINHDHSRLAG
jgi:hypothetical protein